MKKELTYEGIQVLNQIPVGYYNRISRKKLADVTGFSDRRVRKIIEEIVSSQQKLIVSSNGGYFIPDNSQEIDRLAAHKYIQGELKRIQQLKEKEEAYYILFPLPIYQDA